ncbi:MAG: hypothetical protein MSJ26_04485 [Oscillospiraceae bacterium]|nr:hypothetical protein [Oscillospiraceae bacterium]
MPAVSGISIEVREADGKYSLERVLMDGREMDDEDIFNVTCLNTEACMGGFLEDENRAFVREELNVRNAWKAYIRDGEPLLSTMPTLL